MPAVRRSNVYGALDMGLSPSLLPGRASAFDDAARASLAEQWGSVAGGSGRGAGGIIEGLAAGLIDGLLLLGADPMQDAPDTARAAAAMQRASVVIAIDLFLTASAEQADVVFPALGFAEVEGTVTNIEGRVQKVNRLLPGPGQAREAVEILEDLARRLGGSIGATSAEAVAKEIAAVAPAYRGVTWDLLDWGDGRDGIVVPGPEGSQPLGFVPVARDIPAASADLTLHLARTLYDHGTAVRRGPSLAKLSPEPAVHLHPDDARRYGVGTDSPVRISGSGGEAELTVRLDDSLARGTVYLPFNLGVSIGTGLEVRLEAMS